MDALPKPSDVMEMIGQLTDCTTEVEAKELTAHIVRILDGQWFVYTTMLPPERNKHEESYRFFVGCRPELCALYSDRKWMMNDPFFEYARTGSAPITGSQVKILTSGQRELVRACAEFGFRSGIVVPTHTSMDANRRMGVLYIGSELPVDIGEPMLLRNRVRFGALGMELLLWWSERLKRQAMRKLSLFDDDIELLRLSKKGKIATDIAALLDIPLSMAYKRLNLIKEKLNVDRMGQAVAKADSLGLLG